MSSHDATYTIIGSGPAAVMAAQTLIGRGKHVVMLDAGITPGRVQYPGIGNTFDELRRSDGQQWKWLLGKDFRGFTNDRGVETGGHLGPQRRHLVNRVRELIPMESDTFFPLETLARGGLGAAWGLGAYVYNAKELNQAGLPETEMMQAYQVIADRIGISAGKDDLAHELSANLEGIQPPVRMDSLIGDLYSRYKKHRAWFQKRGIRMGHASLAMLTEPKDGRPATKYDELDFYNDDPAAWRPEITLKQLERDPLFSYRPGFLVLSFSEGNQVDIKCLDLATSERCTINTDRLVLACGPLASARIAMRSMKLDRTPLLCNPYAYLAAVNHRFLGREAEPDRIAMAQAMMMVDTTGHSDMNIMVSLYSYRSLLIYRLLDKVPFLPVREAIHIARFITPALVLAGIHFPDQDPGQASLRLVADRNSVSSDHLVADSRTAGPREWKRELRLLRKSFLKAGCIPVSMLDPGRGSSIHYAGTIPYSDQPVVGRQARNGLLHGTRHVYIADASGFTGLPAKGITLTLMANAHRIAKEIDHNA